MAARLIVVSADSILQLLTHYSDGEIDLDAELRGAGVNPMLQRCIGLNVESRSWPADTVVDGAGHMAPLQFRYYGNRIASWTDGDQGSIDRRQYLQRNETPKR